MAIDLSALFGQQPDYSAFLPQTEIDRMRGNAGQQALLNAAISALSMTGQTRQPISTGQVLAGMLGAGSEGYNQAFDRTLKQMVTGMQLEEFKRKRQAQEMARQAFTEVPQYGVVPTETGEMPTAETMSALTMPTGKTVQKLDVNKLIQSIAITDPLEAAKLMTKESKESFRPMTADEKKNAGLPADRPYQISTTGKIQDIGTGPQSVVNVLPAESAQQTGYGKFGVEENTAIFKAGQIAVKNINKINNTLNLLKQGDATTGLGADIINNINRAQLVFSDSKKKINQVSDTELLNSLLGADVFPQIGALGIGAKGLDTPAEREFLRQVMTGTITMNKETLLRLTNLRKKYEEKSITDYNQAVDEGQLDPLFKYSGLPKKKLSIPQAPITVNY